MISLKPYYKEVLNTDVLISPLGIGTVKFGRNEGVKYPVSFKLPTDKEINNILSIASDYGINFLDTAPAYGISEYRLGSLLKNRNSWVIGTKVGEIFKNGRSFFDFSEKTIKNSLENSLKNLKTDYLDIVLIHSNGDDEGILRQTDIVNTLKKAKEAGIIKAIGLSGKTSLGGVLAISEMNLDIAMITHNKNYIAERSVIDYAKSKGRNKTILIKKALSSGHDAKTKEGLRSSLEFVFSENIDSVVLGTINKKHLVENIEVTFDILKNRNNN